MISIRHGSSGATNDRFSLNTLKTLFRLSRVLLDIYIYIHISSLEICILRGPIKFVSVRSS